MARTLDFSDGFTSAAQPTQGSIQANSLKVFVDDAAFVTDKGSAATEGDMYWNSTVDTAKMHDGTAFEELVDTNATQTMANKTMTSPALNTPTIVGGTVDATADISAGALDTKRDANFLENVGLSASVASSALTIVLEQSDGSTDPVSASPTRVGFRSSTDTTGGISVLSVTSSISIVVPSGATLGTVSGNESVVNIYAIDNAGTLELAVSLNNFREQETLSTTILDTSSDSATTIFSTTARTDVPIRFLGSVISTQATAGTWDTAPSRLELKNGAITPERNEIRLNTFTAYGSTNDKIPRFTNVVTNVGGAMTLTQSATDGDSVTVNIPGNYLIAFSIDGTTDFQTIAGLSLNSGQLTTSIETITVTDRLVLEKSEPGPAADAVAVFAPIFLFVGDVMRPHTNGNAPNTAAQVHFSMVKV